MNKKEIVHCILQWVLVVAGIIGVILYGAPVLLALCFVWLIAAMRAEDQREYEADRARKGYRYND